MQHLRAIVILVSLSVVLTLPTGCARRALQGTAAPSARPKAPRLSASADRRVEAQARYASGLAHELRREPDLALEQFILSVRADPTNEDLALEVSRRLLLAMWPLKWNCWPGPASR